MVSQFSRNFPQFFRDWSQFCCLRQVHLAENLPQATNTQNRVKTTYGLKHALHILDGHFR